MEGEIIEKLKQLGKITDEDVSEAMKLIPNQDEIRIIVGIRNNYDNSKNLGDMYSDDETNIWISHFLPILREESFKCMEKVRELITSNDQ